MSPGRRFGSVALWTPIQFPWRAVTKGLMRAAVVVMAQPFSDPTDQCCSVFVVAQIDVFILQAAPPPLDEQDRKSVV